jgi:hypothetical protein
VVYQNTPDEFVGVLFDGLAKKDQRPPGRITWRAILAFTAAGVGVMMLASQQSTGIDVLLGMLAFLLFALAMLLAIQRLPRRLVRSNYEKMCHGPKTVTISPQGVLGVGSYSESFATWNEYSSIEEDDRFIVFYQNARTYVSALIPQSAFASATESERFASLARRYWEHSQPAANLPEPVETGNPYQSPAAR